MIVAVILIVILLAGLSSTSLALASDSTSDTSSDSGGALPLASSPWIDPAAMTSPDLSYQIEMLAEGIARAEGYGADAGNFPTRNNNPGDLTADLIGKAVGFEQGKAVYGNSADGWQNLRQQLALIASGQSRSYSLAMSFDRFAQVWTGGDNPGSWGSTVKAFVGVSGSMTLGEYFGVSA